MDLPLGALTEGFEDRLVLETRSDWARWGEFVIYLVGLPCVLLLSFFSVGLVWSVFLVSQSHVLPLFLLMVWSGWVVYWFFQNWRARNFQEVAVQAERLEVTGGIGGGGCNLDEVLDAKVWPDHLGLTLPSGKRLRVQGLSTERKLRVLERVLPAMARARRLRIQAGEEVRLLQSWKPVLGPLLRAVLFGLVAAKVCGLVDPFWGYAVGGLLTVLLAWPVLTVLRRGGLVLSRSGLRRPWESVDQEVAWNEVESCFANAFFQDTLRVTTRHGKYRWLSQHNPVVWALVIQGLQEEGSR